MGEEREFERLIDAALESYATQVPEDLTARVLARLRREPAPKFHRGWFVWAAIALPTATCALLLVLLGPWSAKPRVGAPVIRSAEVNHPVDHSAPAHALGAQTVKGARKASRRAAPSLAATPQALPKLATFPSPAPLTAEERALAGYVVRATPAEQQALARSEQEQSPLTVASIHVMPLDSPQ